MPLKRHVNGTDEAERNPGIGFRSVDGTEPRLDGLRGSAQVVTTRGLIRGFGERNPTEPNGTQCRCHKRNPRYSPLEGGTLVPLALPYWESYT